MPSLGRVLVMATIPVAKILVMCGIGTFLALPRINIFTAEARKHMNKMVFLVFTPCLIFTRLAQAVTFDKLIDWWYMPINVLLSYGFGALVGHIVTKYSNPPRHLKSLTIACCAAGNTGNFPLVLVPGVCVEEGSPFGESVTCSRNGLAYVSFGMWMATILMWTYIFNLLRPPPLGTDPIAAQALGAPQYIGVTRDEVRPASPNSPPYQNVITVGLEKGGSATVGTSTSQFDTIMSSPQIEFIALIIGGCAPLKAFFIGPQAPLRFFTDCLGILGDAMIPCMNLILGGNLAAGVNECDMKTSTIAGILLTRFFILPVAGCVLIFTVRFMRLAPADPLFHFVLFLQFCMPTAINVGTVAQLHGTGEKEAAVVLFWSYTSSAVFLTVWVMLFLSIV